MDIRDRTFKATVISKIIDNENHGEENLLLKDVETDSIFTIRGYVLRPTLELFRMVNKMDTLTKSENSNVIYIKSQNNFFDSFIFKCEYCD